MNDLFTRAAFGTVAGASAATLLTTNVAGDEKWIIAFFNGLVIFSAALGANQLPPGNRAPAKGTQVADNTKPGFFSSWA